MYPAGSNKSELKNAYDFSSDENAPKWKGLVVKSLAQVNDQRMLIGQVWQHKFVISVLSFIVYYEYYSWIVLGCSVLLFISVW